MTPSPVLEPPAIPATDVLVEETLQTAFSGKLQAKRHSPLYAFGLAIVAVAMVLLPLIYIGLIGGTAWAVVWHLQNDTKMIVGSGRVAAFMFCCYLAPALIGGV